MAYLLLTGATGLLGGYLLRDALRRNLPVAVLVRRSAATSAQGRIDGGLAPWETTHALPRPVVLEGDLSQPGLGLSSEDRAWLAANCRMVLHSAASISFYREPKTNEPYRSNVDGTRHLLDVCREAGIHDFHHVSTAYVCGRRSGRVLEDELDVGQEYGNDYEQSKVAAEKMVLSAGFAKTPTIYRPSIIVGDSATGHTTTYHGFYTPLQLAWLLAKANTVHEGVDNWFLKQLGLSGNERKNIVPVDWVSQVILHILQNASAHGRTYHLTCPDPPTALEIAEAIGDAIQAKLASETVQDTSNNIAADGLNSDIRRHMDVYRAYFRDHPGFDTANLQAAAPHLACPAVDRPLLARTGKFALDANFGWPRILPPTPPLNLDSLLAEFAVSRNVKATHPCTLEITGCGGGTWTFDLARSPVEMTQRGRTDQARAVLRLRSDTLARLAQGSITVEQALSAGRIMVAAAPCDANAALDCLKHLLQLWQGEKPSRKALKNPSVRSGQAALTPR
jgi:thioester reductase-like protein